MPKDRRIAVTTYKLPMADPGCDLAIGFEGVSKAEAEVLIDCVIKIEQARTGDVLTPTEYSNRFSGIDLYAAKTN